VRALAPLVAVSALFLACSSTDTGSITIVLPTNEADTFTRSPAVVTLRIDSVDSSGNATNLAEATLPTTDIDLGDQSEDTTGFVRVLGLDGAGIVRAKGETLPVDFGALDGTSIDVFMQRTGELSELPSMFSDGRPAPLLDFVGSRFVVETGGSDSTLSSGSQLYDLVTYAPLAGPPAMPLVPLSMAVNGTMALLVDASANAIWFDFSDGTTTTVGPATGEATFADVAGGLTFYDDSGTAYIVGATRTTGAPTASVLVIDGTTAELSLDTLTDARLGAAAAYVIGRGLVVAGGGGVSTAGVEVVAAGTTMGEPLGYPPDTTTGAGASALDGSHVLLAGGVTTTGADATTRVIDLSCMNGCTLTPWGALPEALVTAQTFAIDAATAFVVGNDATGATHAVTVSLGGATEVPLRNARTNARAVYLPTGSIGIVGGGSGTIESFTP
jgi:hypothetical protein